MQDATTPPTIPGPTDTPPPGARPARRRDPGTPISGWIALLLAVLLYLIVALSQNLTPYLTTTDAVGRDPAGGEMAKIFLLLDHALGGTGELAATAATQFSDPDMHPADRLQAVLVRGESEGSGAAIEELRSIRSRDGWAEVEGPDRVAVEDGEAVADAAAMETLYGEGVSALDEAERERLSDRYGWLGELALTHGLEDDAPARAPLFDDAGWAVLLIVIVGVAVGAGGLAGLVLLIVAAVLFFGGRLPRRFSPPAPGGSVYLETFAMFLAAFLLIQIVGSVIAGAVGQSGNLTAGVMMLQWLVLPVIFWARLRGASGPEWREATGWHAPRGVMREVGAGVVGYLAGVPLFFAGVLLTLVLNVLSEMIFGAPSAPPTNPVIELVSSGNVLVVVTLVLMATVWAPIVEETVFRGALYRHLRGRTGAFLAGIVTAFLFAFLHSYGPLMTGPLIALGFTFAMIREWRGSLIAPVTAHFLHNATVMTISLIALRAMM